MKLALFIFLALSFTLSAQEYLQLMRDPRVNYNDVVRAGNDYFKDRFKGKGSGYADFQRWQWANESKFAPTGERNLVSGLFAREEFQRFSSRLNSFLLAPAGSGTDWRDLGPYRVEKITGHYAPGLGRVECFYVNPRDTNRIYLGSRSGGFWRSEDGGKNWVCTTDFLPATGVNTMTVSRTNPDSVLINVRNATNGVSHGIYRSIDGGKTWRTTEFNPTRLGKGGLGNNWFGVNEIEYSPIVSGLVFIAANDGLYRSSDDLRTWSKVSNGDCRLVEFHPTNRNVIYSYDGYYWGSRKNVILRSDDQGLTFKSSDLLDGNADNTAVTIDVSKARPDNVYFSSGRGLWVSQDMGKNFTRVSDSTILSFGYAVNDVNPNNMICGTIDTWATNDGGVSFKQKTWWSLGSTPFAGDKYVHADFRVAESINGVFYLGTDGYLCKSNDGGNTWVRLNEGTGIRENYCVGVSQSNTHRSFCGSQDNGQSILTENGWLETYGADGMEGIIQPLNDDLIIGSGQGGFRIRYADGGKTHTGATPPNWKNGSWISPILYDPNNQMRLFAFSDSIYQTEDFGLSWRPLSTPAISTINHAIIAENNSLVMLVSAGTKLMKSIDGGKTFKPLVGLPNYNIADMAFSPRNDNTIVVVYNRHQADTAKVFISRDQGATWTNITDNLINMPINCLAIDNTPEENIYLGAEIGAYSKPMADQSWSLYNSKLPNMAILDLQIQHGANTLRAATWGRGLWECPLVDRADFPSINKVSISSRVTDTKPDSATPQLVKAIVKYAGVLNRVVVRWSKDKPLFTNQISMNRVNDSLWESVQPIPTFRSGTSIFFKVVALGSKGDSTETYKYQYTIKPFTYCTAKGAGNTTADYITSVTLNGTTVTSAKESYANFTDNYFRLVQGDSNQLVVKMNYHWEPDTTAAWIDYNHDGIFDPSEQIVMSTIDADHLSRGSIVVPAEVAKDTTRMRVRSQYWNEKPEPCGERTGEVEDYSVIIQRIPKVTFTVSKKELCSPGYIHLRYTGDPVDTVRWVIENGKFNFSSMNPVDSVLVSDTGTYHLAIIGYRNGKQYITVDDSAFTLRKLDTSVIQTAQELKSNQKFAQYQWLDCSANYAPIAGAEQQSFTPLNSGLYCVELRSGSCVDTSDCVAFTVADVTEAEGNDITISPNPTTGILEVVSDETHAETEITVFDSRGRRMTQTKLDTEGRTQLDLTQVSAGVYYLRFERLSSVSFYRIVKK